MTPIPNVDPQGLVATGQDNSGYAAILDRSTFDPNTFQQNLNRIKLDNAKLKWQDKIEKADARKKAMASLIGTPAWDRYKEGYSTFLDGAQKALAEAGDGDINDIQTPVGQVYAKLNTELTAMENSDKAAKTGYEQWVKYVQDNVDDLDPVEIEKYQEGIDATKTPYELVQYMATTKRPQPNIPFEELIPAIGIPFTITETPTGGNQSSIVKQSIPYPEFKEINDFRMAADPSTPQKYAQGIRMGLWEDMNGMKEWSANFQYKDGKVFEQKLEGARTSLGGGGMDISFNSGGAITKSNWHIVPSKQGGGDDWDHITIDREGGENNESSPIEVDIGTGTNVFGTLEDIRRNSDGTFTAKFNVKEDAIVYENDLPVKDGKDFKMESKRTTKEVKFARTSPIHKGIIAAIGDDPLDVADEWWKKQKPSQKSTTTKKKLPGT